MTITDAVALHVALTDTTDEIVGIVVYWGQEYWPVLHPVYGTLRDLIRNTDHVPPGIWIDRIEECPEELQVTYPQVRPMVLDFLRRKHPNGI